MIHNAYSYIIFATCFSLGFTYQESKSELELPNATQSTNRKFNIKDLTWLSGSWTNESNGIATEEHWIAPRGGMMLAVNRTTNGTKTEFEFIRIQQTTNSIDYLASPSGRPPVPFKLTHLEKNLAVFENPQHDFPQKITYLLQNQKLHVRIEANANGKKRKMEWSWTRSE